MGVSTGGGWGERQGVVSPTRLICFGTYNIQNGQNKGLESTLRRISQANMDLGVFQETKLKKRIYTRESSGYKVVAMEAPGAHIGNISVFYRVSEHFYVEVLQTYRTNVISFQLALGNRWRYIVGCYLTPYNASTIEDVVAAIGKQPEGVTLLVVVNFNGCTRGTGAVRGDSSGLGGGGPRRHERPLPPTARAVVEGWLHMVHTPGRPGCALPDQLHPGHRHSSVPECSNPGRKAQHGPLPGLGVPPRRRACSAFALPREMNTLPYQAPGNPVQDRPYVC